MAMNLWDFLTHLDRCCSSIISSKTYFPSYLFLTDVIYTYTNPWHLPIYQLWWIYKHPLNLDIKSIMKSTTTGCWMVHNGIPPDFMSPGVSGRNRLATHWSIPVDDVTIAIPCNFISQQRLFLMYFSTDSLKGFTKVPPPPPLPPSFVGLCPLLSDCVASLLQKIQKLLGNIEVRWSEILLEAFNKSS